MISQKFKQTEIGKIPEDWEIKKIEDVAEIKMGQSPPGISYNLFGEGIKFMQGVRTFGEKYPFFDTYTTQTTKKAEAGSILLSVRAPVGEINITKEDLCIGRGLASLNMKNGNNEFLYYLLKKFKSLIIGRETGSVFGSINSEQVKNLSLPFPDDSEQISIAKILSSLDEKIELNNKMNKTLEAIGQALFKKWFIDKRKGEWEISKIGDELKTILGGTPDRTKPGYWNGNINWINSGKVNEFRIIEPSEKITELGLRNSATKILPKGSVVLAITGATLGQFSKLEIDTCANQSVIGILENEKISSEYIYFWIKNEIGDIISHQTGGAQQHINKNNLDSYDLLIPDDKTLQDFNKIIQPIFKQISINCFQNQTLSSLRDALLPKLMSGEVRVK